MSWLKDLESDLNALGVRNMRSKGAYRKKKMVQFCQRVQGPSLTVVRKYGTLI